MADAWPISICTCSPPSEWMIGSVLILKTHSSVCKVTQAFSLGPWKRNFRGEPSPGRGHSFRVHPDFNSDQGLWGPAWPGLRPPAPGTYQVQLITLNPLGPAASLLLTLLHTLELVPIPAHRGLPCKKTQLSVLSKQLLEAGGGAAPTLTIQVCSRQFHCRKCAA